MITNWYSTNIMPEFLSTRLRIAYSVWLGESSSGEFPELKQYFAAVENKGVQDYSTALNQRADQNRFNLFFSDVGSKVNELVGIELTAKNFDEVLSAPGQSLAQETFELLQNEHKPVHARVTGSPVLSHDIESLLLPLSHRDPAIRRALFVCDY